MPEPDGEAAPENEVQFLMGLLKKAAAEREQLLMTIAKKDGIIAEQNSVVDEHSTKRALEAEIFAKTLSKERQKFDRRLVKLKEATAKRDELLVAWAGLGTALSVSHPAVMSDAVQRLVSRTCQLLPEAQNTSTSIYKSYVSRMLEGQETEAGVDFDPLTEKEEAGHPSSSPSPPPQANMSLPSHHSLPSQHSAVAAPDVGSSSISGLHDLEKLLGMGPMMSLSDNQSSSLIADRGEERRSHLEEETAGLTVASERCVTAAAPRKFWWDHLVDTSVTDEPASDSKARLMLGSGLDDAADLSD